jgi:tRNA-dihydrouridine synthase
MLLEDNNEQRRSAEQKMTLLRDKVVLAPMVRGSELAFRNIIRRYGIQHCYSPMLRASQVVNSFQIFKKGTYQEYKDSDFLARIQKYEDGILLFTDIIDRKEAGDLTIQLCGSCPDLLYKATCVVLEVTSSFASNKTIHGIDLNLGCPQKCAEDGCFGAFLVERNPELALECVAAMRRAIDDHFQSTNNTNKQKKPRLSCKMRLLETNDTTIDFGKNLHSAGCEILALHCRRRGDKKHNGDPDLLAGKNVVNALSIPVVINGSEVTCLQDIVTALETTRAHSIMIARAFLLNPRVFTQKIDTDPAFLAAEYLDACELNPPPSPLYIQKHLRWIFRNKLQPTAESNDNYVDWRVRLWTFLVRPYLETMYQFRQVVALYVRMNGTEMPASLQSLPEASFQSIRHSRDQIYNAWRDSTTISEEELERSQAEAMMNIFQ